MGANGQLGTDIVRAFRGSDTELTALTRQEYDAGRDDPSAGLDRYRDHDYLINCIAYHKTDQCEQNPEESFNVNGSLVLALAKFCTANDMTFIHMSTDYVFDGLKKEPYVEDDLPSPLNVYGTSKLAGESFARAYSKRHFIFRLSSLFGSKETDDPDINFVEKMLHAARQGEPVRVIDDQFMSPTHARDAARTVRAFIEEEITRYGIYHCCNSGSCSWFEFAHKIFELCRLNANLSPISYAEFHTRARRPQYCSMSNSKLGEFYRMKHWAAALEDYLRIKGYLKE